MSEPIQEQIEALAKNLEEPRAVRLLAEWLAIDHNETRLEFEKYMEDAQELYEYITVIIGFSKPQFHSMKEENVSKVELTMRSLGVEYSSCCGKQFDRGETMFAIVSKDGEPMGWWCSVCVEKHQADISKVI